MCECAENNQINSCNYVENVLKTESPVTEALTARMADEENVERLYVGIKSFILEADFLDVLKKHIFYGKQVDLSALYVEGGNVFSEDVFARISEPRIIRLLHAGIGMVTEAGEFLDMLKAHIFDGKPLDTVNLKEELSDSFWYNGVGLDALETTMNEVLKINIDKLRARYPNNFTEHDAINRNLNNERTILEQHLG